MSVGGEWILKMTAIPRAHLFKACLNRFLSIIQHVYGRTWGATPCFLGLLPILPKMPTNPPTLNMPGVSVLRKVIVRQRFGEAGLAPDLIFTQTYGQGLSYRNVAPWDVQHIKKTCTPFCSPLYGTWRRTGQRRTFRRKIRQKRRERKKRRHKWYREQTRQRRMTRSSKQFETSEEKRKEMNRAKSYGPYLYTTRSI